MQNSLLPKIALCLFSLALSTPALAREWYDITPRNHRSSKAAIGSGHGMATTDWA